MAYNPFATSNPSLVQRSFRFQNVKALQEETHGDFVSQNMLMAFDENSCIKGKKINLPMEEHAGILIYTTEGEMISLGHVIIYIYIYQNIVYNKLK